MPALTHFAKMVAAQQSMNGNVALEITAYTISWADLTGAGFAAGDDVFMLVAQKNYSNSANADAAFYVGFGTTYAGRTDITSSRNFAEPRTTTAANSQYVWIYRRTLVVNENIYFTGHCWPGTADGRFLEFVCLVIKLSALASTDYFFAEATHSGNAPTTYDTSGAGAATPAAGDWLLIASSSWLVDAADDMYMAIHDGTSDIAEVDTEGEDPADEERVIGTLAYKASFGSGVTVRARYRAQTAANDCVRTAIFGLRLNAFESYDGQHTTNTVTHSVVDTYSEFAGFPAFSLPTTGPLVIIGHPIHLTNEATKSPYGRIQIANADWPAAGANRVCMTDNGTAQRLAPFLFGYNASQTGGTLDIDLDAAEDVDVTPNYSCVEQVAVAFTFNMAAAPGSVGMVHERRGRRFQHMVIR